MDKESILELQKIDCNCNDCIFMKRDTDKFKLSQNLHHKWQLDAFNSQKKRVVEKAKWYKNTRNDLEAWNKLLNEAEKMKFQFNNKSVLINYGNCEKLSQEVSFIPNHCQLETQHCFKHRKDGINT